MTFFKIITGPMTLRTSTGLERLETGALFHADMSPAARRLVDSGRISPADTGEVLQAYVDFAKEVFGE